MLFQELHLAGFPIGKQVSMDFHIETQETSRTNGFESITLHSTSHLDQTDMLRSTISNDLVRDIFDLL